MTVQSPASVTSAEMSQSILDNIFTFLLLYNKKADSHRSDYKTKIGLEDHQIDMISSLQPRRDYLLVQDGVSRVMTTHFTPEILAYVRSEKSVMNLFDRLESSGETDWKEQYLAKVAALN
jgi:type IV secretion system protein VirB4